jgi:predicted nucleic acid-binding protein
MCVDASIGAKWLLREPDSAVARRLLTDAESARTTLLAPPEFAPEVASAIYKRFQMGVMTSAQARALLANFGDFPVQIQNPPELAARAFEIAAEFSWKWIYDAFYVALAEVAGCDLWTADARLHSDVRRRHRNVRLLAEYPPA